MRILVCVKQVPDTASRIAVRADGQGIETQGVQWVMNPYDEFAMEAGLQLVERHGGEVVAASVGPARVAETLRTALAMGAERAVHVVTEAALDPAQTATALAAVARRVEPDLIMVGKQAVDDEAAQVGPHLAVALDWPQVMVVVGLEVDPAAGRLVAQRELEGALETVECPLPAVVGAQRGLNTPRYPTLPNIMKAKRKPLEAIPLEALGVEVGPPRLTVVEWGSPPPRAAGQVVSGEPAVVARQLVEWLHRETHIL
jgi:electron transfer flavoprotein beta subunit